MNKPVKIFMWKLLLISSPAIVLVCIYIAFDPFKVLYKYDSYYQSGKPEYVNLNRDYVSLETFLMNNPKYHYDSYIFGSSRSRFYNAGNWGKYIHSDKYFHFDAHGENIYGINKKISFLASHGYPIKNVLLVLDNESLRSTEDIKSHIAMKHFLLSGKSWFEFQLTFFETFCTYDFLSDYLDFKLSGHVKPYMKKNGIIFNTPIGYDLRSNEILLSYSEESIKSNRDLYYKEHAYKFDRIDSISTMTDPVINNQQKLLLQEIKKLFDDNHTQYKIVLNPLYSQERFNNIDRDYLCTLFGKENVFDFSGKNWITSTKYNFYDWSHYRSFISDSIMRVVYQPLPTDTVGPIH